MSIKELVQEEMTYRSNALHNQLDEANLELAALSYFNVDDLTRLILIAQEAYGLEDKTPCLYVRNDMMEVDFHTVKPYGELIDYDDASISYNGNWIHLELVEEINNIKVTINYEGKIPDDVKELLVACGKLVTTTHTNTSIAC